MEMEREIGIDDGRKDSIYGSTIDVAAIPNWKIDRSQSAQRMGKERFTVDQNSLLFDKRENQNRKRKSSY
jgi:hypothetical protein